MGRSKLERKGNRSSSSVGTRSDGGVCWPFIATRMAVGTARRFRQRRYLLAAEYGWRRNIDMGGGAGGRRMGQVGGVLHMLGAMKRGGSSVTWSFSVRWDKTGEGRLEVCRRLSACPRDSSCTRCRCNEGKPGRLGLNGPREGRSRRPARGKERDGGASRDGLKGKGRRKRAGQARLKRNGDGELGPRGERERKRLIILKGNSRRV